MDAFLSEIVSLRVEEFHELLAEKFEKGEVTPEIVRSLLDERRVPPFARVDAYALYSVKLGMHKTTKEAIEKAISVLKGAK